MSIRVCRLSATGKHSAGLAGNPNIPGGRWKGKKEFKELERVTGRRSQRGWERKGVTNPLYPLSELSNISSLITKP